MAIDQLLLLIAADVLYIVTHALKWGARAGSVAASGITAGFFVHIFAAAAGVSALLAASATAFTRWLSARVGAVRKGMHWLERAAGAMFLGFGLKLALSDNPQR